MMEKIDPKFNELTKRVKRLLSDRQQLIECLGTIKRGLTKENIPLYDLVKKIDKVLVEVQKKNNKGGKNEKSSKET